MASRKHERTLDRACAVQVLYTSELKGESPSKLLDEGLCLVATEQAPATEEEAATEFGRICEGSLSDYALALIRGVEGCQAEIDERLEGASENWTLSRMPIVDRSILRLATYEMYHCDDVPVSVSINEAVELAKDFGGEEESPRFVNGVLGRIARSMDEGPEAGGEVAGAEEAPADDSAVAAAAEAPVAEDAPEAGGEVAAAPAPPIADEIETVTAVDVVRGASGAAACVQGEV